MTGAELIKAIQANHLENEEVHPESLLRFTAKHVPHNSVAYQTLHMAYVYHADQLIVAPGEVTYCGFAEHYK